MNKSRTQEAAGRQGKSGGQALPHVSKYRQPWGPCIVKIAGE